MNNPRISVVMPTYNGERYLHEAIESILQQTFRDFEFLIVLDGSTDGSDEIVGAYAEQDARIRVIRNEQNTGYTGMVRSLNKGLQLARGEYIARMDDDDISMPDRFEKEIAYLEAHPEVVLCSCDYQIIDPEGRHRKYVRRTCPPDLVRWQLMFYNYISAHSQVMYRRDAALDLGGYDETDLYTEDYGLWQRMAAKGHLAILPDELIKYRYHSESISRRKANEQAAYIEKLAARSITSLLGYVLEPSLVRDLQAVWMWGVLKEVEFPPTSRLPVLHEALRAMYQAFLEQPALLPKPELRRMLRSHIGGRFYRWAQAIPARQASEKMRVLAYGGRWHPLGLPGVVKQSIQWRRQGVALPVKA